MAVPIHGSPEEFAESYCSSVFYNIREIMKEKSISQISLAHKSGLSQPVVSKLLSGETKGSLVQIAKICWALGVDPSDVLSLNQNTFSNLLLTAETAADHNGICVSPAQSPAAFKGYLQSFYLYYGSTISSENKILNGILTFSESADQNFCNADLKLYTGQNSSLGTQFVKHYTGSLVISLPMSACYCTLVSKELGEICFLVFNHLFLFGEPLTCRMACAATVSAGGNRRPTMHRLLICRDKLDVSDPNKNDYKFLHGQLMLNSSDIHITKSSYEKMQDAESKFFSMPEIKAFLKEFEKNCSRDEVYSIDESQICNAPYHNWIKLSFLSLLREYSITERYNKISAKTDDHVFNYIQSKTERPNKNN